MLEIEYRVRYERPDGFRIASWDNEIGARKFFEDLKSEKMCHTVWAELCFALLDDDEVVEITVIDEFTRKEVDCLTERR